MGCDGCGWMTELYSEPGIHFAGTLTGVIDLKLSEYAELDGIALATAISRGDYSREEVVAAAIEAIEAEIQQNGYASDLTTILSK